MNPFIELLMSVLGGYDPNAWWMQPPPMQTRAFPGGQNVNRGSFLSQFGQPRNPFGGFSNNLNPLFGSLAPSFQPFQNPAAVPWIGAGSPANPPIQDLPITPVLQPPQPILTPDNVGPVDNPIQRDIPPRAIEPARNVPNTMGLQPNRGMTLSRRR